MPDTNYRVLRFDELVVQPNHGEDVAKAVRSAGAPRNAQLLGVFQPLIGVSSNIVTVVTNWTGEPPPPYENTQIRDVRSRLFDTLARGQTPCTASGIYTHRWFVVAPDQVQTLTELSVEAWRSSESDTGMRIAGFWHCRQPTANGEALVLMIVNYPSLTAWDESRYWKPKPEHQAQPNREVWGGLFARRRNILRDSWVTVHQLAK
ncbi:hypothetical protein AS156_14690 [Bradyrhizobium macuxiense]|uniref:NIPSNAP domain-containing protein n=1 Tax=Bradyrhizobium macuxiense TaxID=1755647 RepID=A0A120FK44_9BRAD|nr:hypothetical protein [Bradyrhizobium macuxiense]KWV50017.1 hypothetical protein AS156_14690 [Bradyrhizobium macuxiense]